jgi:hypothetical protein
MMVCNKWNGADLLIRGDPSQYCTSTTYTPLPWHRRYVVHLTNDTEIVVRMTVFCICQNAKYTPESEEGTVFCSLSWHNKFIVV